MANYQAISQWDEKYHTDILHRRRQNAPFVKMGLMGLVGVCGYGIYKYRHKGRMSTSVFLMQLRVAAQGTFVAALTVGLAYSIMKERVIKTEKTY